MRFLWWGRDIPPKYKWIITNAEFARATTIIAGFDIRIDFFTWKKPMKITIGSRSITHENPLWKDKELQAIMREAERELKKYIRTEDPLKKFLADFKASIK